MPTARSLRTLALALTCLAGSVSGDDFTFTGYGPFSVSSTDSGQLSSEAFRASIVTGGVLQVKYLAPRTHCSSVKIHFLVDGEQKALSEAVAPGESSGYVNLGPVADGAHELALRAEGVPGGCNTGRLTSWQGRATAWTSQEGSGYRPPGETLGPALFEAALVNYAWGYTNRGCYIAADGDISAYQYYRESAASMPRPDAQGRYAEAELLEKFSRHRLALGTVPAADVARRMQALAGLGSGPFAESPSAGADQTLVSYIAYIRLAGTDRFAPVLLSQTGAGVRLNLAPGAGELTAWLREAVRRSGCP